MRTLTREELTAALAARQMLLRRERVAPAEAIRRLTPLQGQHPPAPYLALAARLEGFTRAELEAAISARTVVKTTIMRMTLHLCAAEEYPAYAQLCRQPQLRSWRRRYPHLDEERVAAELTAWFAEPRTNAEIRERVGRYEGVADDPWAPVWFARILLPLVQLPPAGHWNDPRRARFVADPRPLPSVDDAAALVLRRYLAAFGPASRRDAAAWSGVPQRDFAAGWDRLDLVELRDEAGTALFDLPDQPLPPASTPIPVRFLGHWDQPLLAHADRERFLPRPVYDAWITMRGDPPVVVDGRAAATWQLAREGDHVQVTVTSHVDIPRAARAEIVEEGERTTRFCEPDAARVEVVGL